MFVSPKPLPNAEANAYYVTTMKHQLELDHLPRRLAKTAQTYAQHAVAQKEITSRLIERLAYIKHQPALILDLSLHPRQSEQSLRQQFPKARYIAATPCLTELQQRKRSLFKKPLSVTVPLGQLPFAEGSVDFIFMSLTLLWTNDWLQLLQDCYRVLKPQGMLLFTTFGPDTLKELRHAFTAVDDAEHVHSFVDMHDIGDVLLKAGFENPVMDVEQVQFRYKKLNQLVRDLKLSGCNNLSLARRRSVLTPRQWAQVEEQYVKSATDQLNATFEFVYGHAWIGERKRQQVDPNTHEVAIPLANLMQSISK